MPEIDVDITKLFEAGAHFGHKTSRWHPKMSSYIHSKRGDSHVINLEHTVDALERVLPIVTETVARGQQVLLVGTKKQAKDVVRAAAEAVSMPYVVERWLGGMLTNKKTINGRITRLKDLETRMANGDLASRYNKLEVQRFQEEIDKMNHAFGGIKELAGNPGLIFVTDMHADNIAITEANRLKVPVIALADTNANPTKVKYPVPCNDDAIKAIALVLEYLKAAIQAGLDARGKAADAAAKPEPQAEAPKE